MKFYSLCDKQIHSIVVPKIKHCLLGAAIVGLSLHYHNGTWELPQHAIIYGVIATILLPYLNFEGKAISQKERMMSGILAFVIATIIVLGERFFVTENWSLCFPNTISIAIAISQTACLGYVFYLFVSKICSLIKPKEDSAKVSQRVNLRKWGYIILTVKLLFFAAFFPCAFDFDAISGLRTYLDSNSAICDHHPFFVQIIHASAFLCGKSIGLSAAGFAVVTICFIIISTFILLYGIRIEEKCGVPYKWVRLTAAIYAFFPLFPFLSVNTTKDGFFAYTFLLYLFSLVELYISRGTCLKSKRFLWQHGLTILFICLTRHQGLYIVFLEAIILLFQYSRKWKTLAVTSFLPITIFLVWSKFFLPFLNVEPGGKQELFGFFFQQTAYYLVEHPEDITIQESLAIDNVLEIESLAQNYKYYIQDPVKRGYKYNPWYRPYFKGLSSFRHVDRTKETEALRSYMSAWLSMGIRHPLTYIKATCANTLGFFYNFDRPLLATEPYWATNRSATTQDYRFYYENKVAEFYFKNINSWMKVPFINWILAIPYYIWTVILLLLLLVLRKGFKENTIFLPVFLSLCILLICPVAYGRYTYPIVISIPLLFSFLFSKCKSEERTED